MPLENDIKIRKRRTLHGNISESYVSQDTTEEMTDSLVEEFNWNCDNDEHEDEDENGFENSVYSWRSSSRDSLTPDRQRKFEISRSVPRTPERQNPSNNLFRSNQYISPKSLPTNNHPVVAVSRSYLKLFLCVFFVISMIAGYYCILARSDLDTSCSFKELQTKYPEQTQYLWRSLTVGIDNIVKGKVRSPAVYLLCYSKKSQENHLIKEIALHANHCFGNSLKLLEMKADDFKTAKARKDYGEIIEEFRSKIKNGKVVLISHLNEIPAESAKALHVICDTISPIIKDLVVFLTLQVPTEKGTTARAVYDVLVDLWGAVLKENELDPLITRITDHTIFLKTET